MPTRRSLIVALALTVMAAPAFAADPAAEAFLAGIYGKYKGENAKGQSFNTTAEINRLFTPSLAKLIGADAKGAAKRNEVGILGGDPFIDAQDFEITDLIIAVTESAPGKATGTVRFKNFGKDTTVTLALVKLPQGWRIDEIRMPSGSLRALFKKAR